MPNTKEIRRKIVSVQSTQKITRAMEMVAASKMRKAQQRMLASRPYLQRVQEVISHLVHGNLECRHSFLVAKPVKKSIFFPALRLSISIRSKTKIVVRTPKEIMLSHLIKSLIR